MSIAQFIGDQVRQRIIENTQPIFTQLNIQLEADNIWHDFAQISPDGFKAIFYIKGVDNVTRKEFNKAVEQEKQTNLGIKTFKVKYKRPDKEVRFELEMV